MLKLFVLLCLGLVPTLAEPLDVNLWNEVCLHNGVYSCENIAPPKVESKEFDNDKAGEYAGGDTIYLAKDIEVAVIVPTIYHEFVHYLQVQTGNLVLPGDAVDVCAAEDEAYKLTAEWIAVTPFRSEETLPFTEWWESYPECWMFYDETYQRIVELIMRKNSY